MPNTSSAKKAYKVSERKASRNRRFQELYKESVKQLRDLLKTPTPEATVLSTTLSKIYSRIDTLAKKNIIHENTAARRKSAFARTISLSQK